MKSRYEQCPKCGSLVEVETSDTNPQLVIRRKCTRCPYEEDDSQQKTEVRSVQLGNDNVTDTGQTRHDADE